jgi:hypothetical protein
MDVNLDSQTLVGLFGKYKDADNYIEALYNSGAFLVVIVTGGLTTRYSCTAVTIPAVDTWRNFTVTFNGAAGVNQKVKAYIGGIACTSVGTNEDVHA